MKDRPKWTPSHNEAYRTVKRDVCLVRTRNGCQRLSRPDKGDGMITVNRTTVIDPDGNIVEINQILDGLDLDTEGF